MGSPLLQKQFDMTRMIVKLLTFAHVKGYEVTLGDAYRDPRAFGKLGESKGYGHPKSGHKQRLAIDLNLFKNGKPLDKTEDHKELGEFWELLGGTWGGRFNDGNHYSIEFNGVR